MRTTIGSMSLATVGSPNQPNARLATETPTCTVSSTSSKFWCNFCTVRAPMRRASISCWMRVSRTLTKANSAATKKALAAISSKIMNTRNSNWASIRLLIAILRFVGWAVDGSTTIDKSKLGEVKRETIDKNVVATGKVEPITKAEIKSKASGIVKRILVDAGQKVKAGQVLMELDREEIQARVRQARAQLAGADGN